jgi:hypothetical protein
LHILSSCKPANASDGEQVLICISARNVAEFDISILLPDAKNSHHADRANLNRMLLTEDRHATHP